jgi:hypothetical protein
MDAKLKLAGLLGAAVLAIPGAGLITNAVAADGTSSTTTEQQAPQLEPTQGSGDQQRPDRDDCPEKDGQNDGSGSDGGGSGTSL